MPCRSRPRGPPLAALLLAGLALPTRSSSAPPPPPAPAAPRSVAAVTRAVMEINRMASELFQAGDLRGEAAAMIDRALGDLDAATGRLDASAARELHFMVSVVRGTVRQQAGGLSDAEVEADGSAYTLASPRLWDEHYKSTPAELPPFDWYGAWGDAVQASSLAGGSGTLGDVVRPHLRREDQLVVLGCGRSSLPEALPHPGAVSGRLQRDCQCRHQRGFAVGIEGSLGGEDAANAMGLHERLCPHFRLSDFRCRAREEHT